MVLLLVGCDDLFTPAIENNKEVSDGREDPLFAEGILANAYTRNPYSSQSFNDVATDDAVTNQTSNSYLKMATGSWTSNSNPMDQWSSCKAAIHYLNLFLSEVDLTTWANDEVKNAMFIDRLKGEAYGLRAMFSFYMLQAHAGWTADGRLLGVPIVETVEDENTDFNYPRNTFEECIQAIYDDVAMAEDLLPLDYENISSENEIPSKYLSQGVNVSLYNAVFGQNFRTRMSGRIAKAFRAKAALLAASPAFADGSTVSWADAADYNGELLDLIGGISGLDADGNTWYKNGTEIDNLGAGENPQEMLWRNGKETSAYSLEQTHFPPQHVWKWSVEPDSKLG